MKLKPIPPFKSPTGIAIANPKTFAIISRVVSMRVGRGLGTRMAIMIYYDIWYQFMDDVYEHVKMGGSHETHQC